MALAAANIYVIFFNLSWGPVMWVMLGEMFPNQIRGSGLAVAGAAQWSANFLITVTFPVLLTSIGLAGAYGLYTAAALGALLGPVLAGAVYDARDSYVLPILLGVVMNGAAAGCVALLPTSKAWRAAAGGMQPESPNAPVLHATDVR